MNANTQTSSEEGKIANWKRGGYSVKKKSETGSSLFKTQNKMSRYSAVRGNEKCP